MSHFRTVLFLSCLAIAAPVCNAGPDWGSNASWPQLSAQASQSCPSPLVKCPDGSCAKSRDFCPLAPGQAGTTPGRSGTTPGQSGATPSMGGDVPGQAGTTPGQAGLTPGNGGMGSCGDGNIQGQEECDDGGESGYCDLDCTLAACGDGTVNTAAGESCDDIGASAFCDADCSFALCGDATFNPLAGEECDDGGESAACDLDCTVAFCGDGTLNPTAGEQCDDGNPVSGDGCSTNCTIETNVPSLLAHYKFDHDATDSSGNGYNGVLVGTETYVDGYDGEAIYFNGGTFVATQLDIDFDVHPQLTMGAWVRSSPLQIAGGFVMTHDDGHYDRSLIAYGGDWYGYAGPQGSPPWFSVPGNSDPDVWQFVAISFDQDAGTVLLYAHDGNSVNTISLSGKSIDGSDNLLHIGYNPYNQREWFTGLVDEAFVINGALTEEQLDEIRLSGVESIY